MRKPEYLLSGIGKCGARTGLDRRTRRRSTPVVQSPVVREYGVPLSRHGKQHDARDTWIIDTIVVHHPEPLAVWRPHGTIERLSARILHAWQLRDHAMVAAVGIRYAEDMTRIIPRE
jgi:hypothetical protein